MKTNDILMKSIKIHKVENAMEPSSEEAPYLAMVESAGTVDTEAFAEQMVEDGCTESKETIIRYVESSDSVIKTCVGEQLMKVYTGDGSLVSPFIYGSFDAPDAAVGLNNAVEPQIRLGADLREAVSDIIPEDTTIVTELGGVRILSMMTEDVGFGYIKGTTPFSIAGCGFKPSATSSAAVSLVNKKTGLATAATVVSIDSTQRIKAKMSTALAAGGYKVVVTVTDGTKVRSAERSVTALEGEPATPALTSVQQGNRAAGTAGFGQGEAAAIVITGTIPGGKKAGDVLRLDCLNDDGSVYATMNATSYITASDETELHLGNGLDNDSPKPDGDWQNKQAKFTLVRDGVEYPLTFTFINA